MKQVYYFLLLQIGIFLLFFIYINNKKEEKIIYIHTCLKIPDYKLNEKIYLTKYSNEILNIISKIQEEESNLIIYIDHLSQMNELKKYKNVYFEFHKEPERDSLKYKNKEWIYNSNNKKELKEKKKLAFVYRIINNNLKSLILNYETFWNIYPPCHPNDEKETDLIFISPFDKLCDINCQDMILKTYQKNMNCFDKIYFINYTLTEYKYPESSLFLASKIIKGFNREIYSHLFLCEHDLYPIQSYWISSLNYLAKSRDFWIMGSNLVGDFENDYSPLRSFHINSNALYHIEDDLFISKVDDMLKLAPADDYSYYLYFSDPKKRNIWGKYKCDYFLLNFYIQNNILTAKNYHKKYPKTIFVHISNSFRNKQQVLDLLYK